MKIPRHIIDLPSCVCFDATLQRHSVCVLSRCKQAEKSKSLLLLNDDAIKNQSCLSETEIERNENYLSRKSVAMFVVMCTFTCIERYMV